MKYRNVIKELEKSIINIVRCNKSGGINGI